MGCKVALAMLILKRSRVTTSDLYGANGIYVHLTGFAFFFLITNLGLMFSNGVNVTYT